MAPKIVPKVGLAMARPIQILKVMFNALEVMCSPNLGGPVKVSISDFKKWSPQIYKNSLTDLPDESTDTVAEPIPLAESMTVDEEEEPTPTNVY